MVRPNPKIQVFIWWNDALDQQLPISIPNPMLMLMLIMPYATQPNPTQPTTPLSGQM